MEKEIIYIYGLTEPGSDKVEDIRYVGKTNNLKRRRKDHIYKSKNPTKKLHFWILSLLEQDLSPDIRQLDIVPDDVDWEEWEVQKIAEYREMGARLFNIMPGGNAPPDPKIWATEEFYNDPERCLEIRERVIDHWADPEARQRHIEGLLAAWKGNEERKQWLSEFNAQRELDPEYRERHRQAVIDSRTDEVCAQISEAKKEFYKDPEHRKAQAKRQRKWAKDNPDQIREGVNAMNQARLEALETEEGYEAHLEASELRRQTLKGKWADPEYKAMQLEIRRRRKVEKETGIKDPELDALVKENTRRARRAARQRYRERRDRGEVNTMIERDTLKAANVLGKAETTIYNWCRAGRFGKKVDGRWVITDQEIEEFQKGNKE